MILCRQKFKILKTGRSKFFKLFVDFKKVFKILKITTKFAAKSNRNNMVSNNNEILKFYRVQKIWSRIFNIREFTKKFSKYFFQIF